MTRLDELFIRFKTPGTHDDYHLIAHRENIWLYNADDTDNEQLVTDIQQRTGLQGQDLDDLAQEATERCDLITGVYHASRGEFWHQGDPSTMTHNPAVSQYFKKLIDFLGVDSVNGNRLDGMDDVEVETMRHEMQGKIPDEMHHGTNTGAIRKIMRFGLVPGEGDGNWADNNVPQFEDLIFLTEDFSNAKYHAWRQANQLKLGAPVILKVKVPDPTKIVPDYDVMTQMGGNPEVADELAYSGSPQYYDDRLSKSRDEIAKNNPGSDLSMISGIVGYRGRIPANHIIEIHASLMGEMGDQENPEYHQFNSWAEFDEALNIYENYEYWYPGIEDELEEDEQEDEDY
jgi:hypothetical protein